MQIPDDFILPDENIARLQKPEALRHEIEKGNTLQQIMGYSDELMDDTYEKAYLHFQNGSYDHALELFALLTTLNPYVYAYWLGFAMSCQFLEEYEQAILGYECASGVMPHVPMPYYYIAVCSVYLDEMDDAACNLLIAKTMCKPEQQFLELKEKIQKLEEIVNKRKRS